MKRATIQQRRIEWAKDQARTKASMRDSTWNGKQHICCGSKKGIRHYVSCKNAPCNYVDDLSDLKDL